MKFKIGDQWRYLKDNDILTITKITDDKIYYKYEKHQKDTTHKCDLFTLESSLSNKRMWVKYTPSKLEKAMK